MDTIKHSRFSRKRWALSGMVS